MWANNEVCRLKETAKVNMLLTLRLTLEKLLFLVPTDGISRQPTPFAKIRENAVRRCPCLRISTFLPLLDLEACRSVAERNLQDEARLLQAPKDLEDEEHG